MERVCSFIILKEDLKMNIAERLEKEVFRELEDLECSEGMELDEYESRVNAIEKLTKVTIEERRRQDEKEAKEQQLKLEEKRHKTENVIKMTTFGITTGVSIWTVFKTFKFDGEKIFSSTLGRSIVQNVSNLFKRH